MKQLINLVITFSRPVLSHSFPWFYVKVNHQQILRKQNQAGVSTYFDTTELSQVIPHTFRLYRRYAGNHRVVANVVIEEFPLSSIYCLCFTECRTGFYKSDFLMQVHAVRQGILLSVQGRQYRLFVNVSDSQHCSFINSIQNSGISEIGINTTLQN